MHIKSDIEEVCGVRVGGIELYALFKLHLIILVRNFLWDNK